MVKATLITTSSSEFGGMMDYAGKLIENNGSYSFLCENGDTVTIPVKSQRRDGDVLIIKSKTGATWKFRIVPVKVQKPAFGESVQVRPSVLA